MIALQLALPLGDGLSDSLCCFSASMNFTNRVLIWGGSCCLLFRRQDAWEDLGEDTLLSLSAEMEGGGNGFKSGV